MLGGHPAEAVPGGGCGAAEIETLDEGSARGSMPELVAQSAPLVQRTFSVAVEGGPQCAHGCLLFSFTGTTRFLRRFQAVNFLAEPALVRVFDLDPSGNSDELFEHRIPDSLCGTELYLQAFVEDPSAPGGIAFTNGLRVRFGQR
jgi:hypothetical protein